MSDTRVKVHTEGPVLVITFDHPPAHAVNQKFSRDLTAAIQRLEDGPDLRCAIITATGDRMFCAGWDRQGRGGRRDGRGFRPLWLRWACGGTTNASR